MLVIYGQSPDLVLLVARENRAMTGRRRGEAWMIDGPYPSEALDAHELFARLVEE